MGYVLVNRSLELYVSKWHRPNLNKKDSLGFFTETIDDALVFRSMPLANAYLKMYHLDGYQLAFINETPPPPSYKMVRKTTFALH